MNTPSADDCRYVQAAVACEQAEVPLQSAVGFIAHEADLRTSEARGVSPTILRIVGLTPHARRFFASRDQKAYAPRSPGR